MVYALSDCKMLNELVSRVMLFGAAYAKAMAELKVLADRYWCRATVSATWPQSWRGWAEEPQNGLRESRYGVRHIFLPPPSRLRAPVSP